MFSTTRRRLTELERGRLHRHAFPSFTTRWMQRLSNRRMLAYSAEHFLEDYNRGEVEVVTGTVQHLAAGDEWNNEGPIYMLGFEGGNWLWLCGQWLFDSSIVEKHLLDWFDQHPEDAWPDMVQVERLPVTGMVISVSGTPRTPIVASKLVAHKDLYYLRESHRFAGALASLEEDLKQAFYAGRQDL